MAVQVAFAEAGAELACDLSDVWTMRHNEMLRRTLCCAAPSQRLRDTPRWLPCVNVRGNDRTRWFIAKTSLAKRENRASARVDSERRLA